MWKRRLFTISGWMIVLIGIVWTIAPPPGGCLVVAAGLGMACMNSLASRIFLKRVVNRYPRLRHPLKRLPGIAGRIWLVGKERQLVREERRRLKAIAKAREDAARSNGVKP
ncbi:MAG: hypothetical protein KDG89_02345 [Geminicoccaceae bacterium]|nr:hypothetical protein [Geminicoccaceae bacterium]